MELEWAESEIRLLPGVYACAASPDEIVVFMAPSDDELATEEIAHGVLRVLGVPAPLRMVVAPALVVVTAGADVSGLVPVPARGDQAIVVAEFTAATTDAGAAVPPVAPPTVVPTDEDVVTPAHSGAPAVPASETVAPPVADAPEVATVPAADATAPPVASPPPVASSPWPPGAGEGHNVWDSPEWRRAKYGDVGAAVTVGSDRA